MVIYINQFEVLFAIDEVVVSLTEVFTASIVDVKNQFICSIFTNKGSLKNSVL